MTTTRVILSLSLALALQTPAHAQANGDKVSVTTSAAPGRVVGRWQGMNTSHVTLGVGDSAAISIPLASVSDARVSLGKDRGKGARIGGAVGLVLGGWFVADVYEEVAESDYFGFGRLILFGIGGVIAPATGAAVGALIPPESWRTVVLPTALEPPAEPPRILLTLPADERVRVRTREGRHSGVVRANTPTVLTIASPETTNIAWSDVTELKVRGGRHRVRGALLGAAALVAVGIYGETTEGATTSTGERIGAFTGAALVGGFLGSRFLGGRGWVSLPLPR